MASTFLVFCILSCHSFLSFFINFFSSLYPLTADDIKFLPLPSHSTTFQGKAIHAHGSHCHLYDDDSHQYILNPQPFAASYPMPTASLHLGVSQSLSNSTCPKLKLDLSPYLVFFSGFPLYLEKNP